MIDFNYTKLDFEQLKSSLNHIKSELIKSQTYLDIKYAKLKKIIRHTTQSLNLKSDIINSKKDKILDIIKQKKIKCIDNISNIFTNINLSLFKYPINDEDFKKVEYNLLEILNLYYKYNNSHGNSKKCIFIIFPFSYYSSYYIRGINNNPAFIDETQIIWKIKKNVKMLYVIVNIIYKNIPNFEYISIIKLYIPIIDKKYIFMDNIINQLKSSKILKKGINFTIKCKKSILAKFKDNVITYYKQYDDLTLIQKFIEKDNNNRHQLILNLKLIIL